MFLSGLQSVFLTFLSFIEQHLFVLDIKKAVQEVLDSLLTTK